MQDCQQAFLDGRHFRFLGLGFGLAFFLVLLDLSREALVRQPQCAGDDAEGPIESSILLSTPARSALHKFGVVRLIVVQAVLLGDGVEFHRRGVRQYNVVEPNLLMGRLGGLVQRRQGLDDAVQVGLRPMPGTPPLAV